MGATMPDHYEPPRSWRTYAALAAWIAVAVAVLTTRAVRRYLATPSPRWRTLAHVAAAAVFVGGALALADHAAGRVTIGATTVEAHDAGIEAPAEPVATADPLLQPGHYAGPRDDATVGPPMLRHAAPGGPDDGTPPGWLPDGLARWWPDIVAAAHEHGLDSHAWGAIVAQECPTGDPACGSHAGARGLAQIMPATAADIEASTGLPCRAGAHDGPTSLRCGAWYYAERVRDAGDLWQSSADDEGVLLVAAAAYNGGGLPASDVRRAVAAGAADVCAGVRYAETALYCRAFRDRWRQTLVERGGGPVQQEVMTR